MRSAALAILGAATVLVLVSALPVLHADEAPEPGRDAPPGHVPADQPLILPPADRARVDTVAEQMICYCGCARQTVKDCTCGVADQIKKDIWRDLGAGKTADTIVAAFVTEHGSEFRSMPKGEGLGVLAWTLPYIALGLAILVILPVVARWTRRPPGQPPAAGARDATGAAGDAYASQVDKELSELD